MLCLLAAQLTLAQAGQQVAISKHVSVQFPVNPVTNEQAAATTFVGRSPDSTFNIVAVVTDMNKAIGLSPEALAAEMEKEETWKQAEETFVSSMGARAKLLQSSFTELVGLKTMKLEIERPGPGEKPNILTVFIFTYEGFSYNLIFVNRSGKADAKQLTAFVQSVVLTK
jgi:hypothetical protein